MLSCWARVVTVFFNNLCVGKTLSGGDLQVVQKSEDIVLLLVYFFSLIAEMVAWIRYEDRLDGMSNYLQWKVMMTVLKENILWTIVSTMVTPPASDLIALFFNNLCVGKTLFGCDLQVVGKSEDIVLLLVYFFFFDSRDGCMH